MAVRLLGGDEHARAVAQALRELLHSDDIPLFRKQSLRKILVPRKRTASGEGSPTGDATPRDLAAQVSTQKFLRTLDQQLKALRTVGCRKVTPCRGAKRCVSCVQHDNFTTWLYKTLR